jgi:predicted DNA-binding protein
LLAGANPFLPKSTIAGKVSSYFQNTVDYMPISVRLDPALEARLDQEVRRLGVTKSEFVKDALERVLGLKSPASLLQQVQSNTPMGDSDASENVSAKIKATLRAKHSD